VLDIEVEYTYQDKTRNELLCFGLQHIAKDLKYGGILTDGERKFSFMGYHFVERDHSDGKELITVRPMESQTLREINERKLRRSNEVATMLAYRANDRKQRTHVGDMRA